jgi:putative glutamine amidotransferase
MLKSVDGVLFPGGGDIDPQLYNEPKNEKLRKVDRELDCFQIIMARLAIEREMPVLGICRGIQLINVVLGGTLVQDIQTQKAKSPVSHEEQGTSRETEHEIAIMAGTRLHSLFGTRIMVNSWHHQSIDTPGKGLVISAVAPDGVIEAVEHTSLPIDLVQWHPELMIQKNSDMLPLFNAFVEKCKLR